MNKIAVVINTFREEANIEEAIKSAKKIADEIVVVDMHSDDKTVEIAKKTGAKVYLHENTDYVEPARNFAVSKATMPWVFVLDADERIGDALAKKLKEIAKNPKADYYTVPRKNVIFGKWMRQSRWWPDYNVRFLKKGHVYWTEKIHGVPQTDGAGADLEAKEAYAIEHYHYDNLEQYVSRMNRYTTIQAVNLQDEGYKFRWQDLVQKPASEFFSRYFFGKGYKDGLHGLALSLLQAFSELVLYLKVWQRQGFKKDEIDVTSVIGEVNKVQKDLNYWKADTLLAEKGGIKNKIKRKLKLH